MAARDAKPEARQGPPERVEEKPRRESESVGGELAAPGRMSLPGGTPGDHASALNRAAGPRPGLAAHALLQLQRQYGNRHVQRVVALARQETAPGGEISPEVEQSISSARGNGRALDSAVRGRMESSFGTDFGGVRVHTGAEPDRLNRQLSARAFTTGSDIFFRAGEYRPGSSGGRELIAHELTHVVQQQGAVQTSSLTLGPPGDRFEQEAESVAQRVMRDEAVSVAAGAPGVARSIQREDDEDLENDPYAEKMNPVIVPAGTFDQAATNFANALRERYPLLAGAGVIVINGANIRVYDGYGQPVASTAFRLKRPSGLGPGVYAQFPDSGFQLRKVYQLPDGTGWDVSPATVTGSDIDFRRDVEPRAPFDTAFKEFRGGAFFLVPGVVPSAAEDELPKPQESKPEFMKFDTHGKADLPAWPSAVVPLTPQMAPVGTTGKFYCKLDKVSWFGSTVDNVFNLLERVNFKWEVLKLDPKLLVTEKERATRWAATKQRFRTKERHIRADEQTMRGDAGASVPEAVFRDFMTDQMAAPRRILGYTGEAVLTLMNSLVGGKDPNVEDYIDFTFKQPGDYFVRCLASPITGAGKKRRATSVAGVLISVHKVEDIAAVAIETPEQILEGATEDLGKLDDQMARLRKEREEADSPEKKRKVDLRLGLFEPRRAFLEAVQKAGGDTHGVLAARLDLVRAQLKFVTGGSVPKFIYTPNQVELQQIIAKLKQDEKQFAGQLERSDSKLGDLVKRTGFMRAILLDDVTGAQQEVLLSIGERELIVTNQTEVVIADVTSKKGRRFTGMGTGAHARSDAWTGAMRDLQRNLGRGRGWLSYQAPPPYGSMMQGLTNPMQLQVAEIDQIKDVVDDAMNAATIAALIAAPFTGGASLGLLAVLMPIQLGSSLYNIVNRAMYDDLELDADAVFSLLDIASFGFAKAATMGKVAKRSVSMMSMNNRIALGLLDGGGYVLLSFTTYEEIMKDVPGETPQDARVRKLRALLGLFQASAMPIASKLFGPAGLNPDGSLPGDKTSADPVPADKPGADTPVTEKPAPEPAPAKPAPKSEAAPDVPKEYAVALKGAPKKVPPMINPDLEAGTVRIQYLHTDGVITHMWMEIGPGTPAARVKQHVQVARDMARYMGLSGRVRKIYQQIEAWLSKNRAAGPGSRAWEARLEVAKLQRIIDEQFAAYDKAVDEKNTALRDALSRELDHLESQLLAHARDVDKFEAGRGFVAAEGTGGTFSPETSRSEAFRELGGFETRAGTGGLEAASDLRSFADTVVREGLASGTGGIGGIGGIDDIVLQMPDPRGLSPETVRDQIKQPYLAKLAERVTDAKRLRSLASYRAARKGGETPAAALYRASHAEGTRILDSLPEADRAAFIAAWSAKSGAIPAPSARRGEIQPETLTGVPAPPAPAHQTLDQLLTPDKAGFTDKELQDAYTDYIARNTRAGDPVATPEEWVALTRGGPRKRLETLLGPGYAFGGTGTGVERQLPLVDFARPAAYTQQRLDADVAAVEKDAGKLWDRVGRLQNEGVTGGVVGESLFNILKGNAAEILSRKIQDTELAQVQKQHPDAKLYDDVRASIVLPDGSRTKMLLFTDNVIASKRGQGLQLHAVFEVKSGSKGGQEATTQVFDWIEGKLDDNTQIQIQVGGDVYVYDPKGKAPNRVIGLARADRHLIAAQGAEHLGLDSGDQIARAPQRHALPQTADEINFLTRALIEKHIAQKEGPVPPAPAPAPAAAPATTPAALPEPARRPGTRDAEDPLETAQEEYLSSPHTHSPEDAQRVLSETHTYLEATGMISDWTPATNAAGAEVFKSLTRITSEPSHVEGFVVYGRRKGKKVTIITGYHGSSEGLTTPEKDFAVKDAKYYNRKYPDVDVIDASKMTHDQRLALIEAIPGVVIVSTCYGASAAPSAPAPGQPRGGHAASIYLPNPEMFKRLSEGINSQPRASHSTMIEHHRMLSPSYGLIETVQGVNVRRAAPEGTGDLGEVRPGLEGLLEEALHAVSQSDTTLGTIRLLEAEKVLGKKGDLWFSPSRELAQRYAHDFDELILHVQSVVDSY
jgi:hypothetical protein